MSHSDNVVEMRDDAEGRLQREEQRRLDEALGWMNERYAVVTNVGGKYFVADLGEHAREPIRLLTQSAFLERHTDQRFRIGRKAIRLTKAWWDWPQRRTLDRMEFRPGEQAPPHILNLWRGWPVEPDARSEEKELRERCELWLRFVLDVIADGNGEHFRYILAWVADMLQNPTQRPGVALMLRGRQGTGKSFFAEHVGELVAPHYVRATQERHVVGHFNSAHEHTLLLHCEEAFFALSPSIVGPLKSLITDDTMTVEHKGCAPYQARNFVHMLVTTNEDVAVPAATDDRRFAAFDVSDARRGGSDHFAAIDEEWRTGGREAFFGLMLQTDLPQQVSLRKIPDTAARREQKQGSAEPHIQWLQGCLAERQIVGRAFQASDTGAAEAPRGDIADADEGDTASAWPSGKVTAADLFDAYRRWVQQERESGIRLREVKGRAQFGKAMRPFFGETSQIRAPGASFPARGWLAFPSYEQVREAFERETGLDIDDV